MQKQQKKRINSLFLINYYKYNFKYTHNLGYKFQIIRKYFNLVNKINYNKIIIKLFIWFKIVNCKQPSRKFKKENFIDNFSKRVYKNYYFDNLFNQLKCYFFQNKLRFVFKRITNEDDDLQ